MRENSGPGNAVAHYSSSSSSSSSTAGCIAHEEKSTVLAGSSARATLRNTWRAISPARRTAHSSLHRSSILRSDNCPCGRYLRPGDSLVHVAWLGDARCPRARHRCTRPLPLPREIGKRSHSVSRLRTRTGRESDISGAVSLVVS